MKGKGLVVATDGHELRLKEAGAPRDAGKIRRGYSANTKVKIFWGAFAVVLVLIFAVVKLPRWKKAHAPVGAATADAVSPGPAAKTSPPPAAGADTKTKLQAAEEYTERKDYSMAEDIYKQVLHSEPRNVEALKALASVLYREDKIEESAEILDRIPKTN